MKHLILLLSIFTLSFTTPSASTDINNDTTIVIESNDQMKFNKSEITVYAGETITLTLKHTGTLPAAAMGHNWVLLKRGTDLPTFARLAMSARDNGFVPVNSPDVIVATKVIGGGEQTTITFEAPGRGEYDFICSFPGHFSLMKGKFIVV